MIVTKSDSFEEFSTRFSKQAGVIHPAKNPKDALEIVNDLIANRGKGDSCASEAIEKYTEGSRVKTTVSYDALLASPRKLVGQLDVGITKAAYGIAETGSIVDISYTDEHRLLSSLTRVHIAVLESSSILDKLSRLSPVMNSLLKLDNPKKPSITFIGGPSRTSDIELKSVLGVHGPHEVHCILLDQ